MNTTDALRHYPERTLLSFLEDPVAVISAKGRLVYLNPAFRRRFEVGDREVLGKKVSEVLPAWMGEPILDQFSGLKPGGPACNFWLGSERERFRVSMAVITLKERVAGAVATIWDASREVDLKRQNLEIFRAICDDLSYPLEELKVLLSHPGSLPQTMDSSARIQLEQVQEGFLRYKEFCETFFGLDRAERVPFHPGRLIALARKSLRPLARQRGVHLEEGSARELPRVLGDPALLNRVLGLAVDYMIKVVPKKELVVLAVDLVLDHDGSPLLVYSISGTGVVDLETERVVKAGSLIEDFISLSDDRKRLLLRLLLARRLVSAMGGVVTVAAHELAGTTLSVRLPTGIHYQTEEQAPPADG